MRVLSCAAALASVLLVVRFAYQHRSYFHEVRRVLEPDHTPLAVHFTGQTSNDLGVYYHMGAYLGQPELSSDEEATLATAWRAPVAFGAADHPVSIAQNGLRNFSRYRATSDPRFLDHAHAAGDLLLNLQQANGAWEYTFDFNDLEAGWHSAMAQGQAISLLLRLHQHRSCDKHLLAARAAWQFMMTPIEDGGTLGHFSDGGLVLEEYPGSEYSPHTLNGSIFALWGLRDYALVTGDREAQRAFEELSRTLLDRLSGYDTGSWSRYSLPQEREYIASKMYHRIHIVQLRAMAEVTGDARWSEVAERWQRYRVEEARRSPVAKWWDDTRRRIGVLARKYGGKRR